MVRREMRRGGRAAGRGDGEMAGASVEVCSHGVDAIVWRGPGTGGGDIFLSRVGMRGLATPSNVDGAGCSLSLSGDANNVGGGTKGATSGAGCVVDAGFFGVARMVGAELRACSAS